MNYHSSPKPLIRSGIAIMLVGMLLTLQHSSVAPYIIFAGTLIALLGVQARREEKATAAKAAEKEAAQRTADSATREEIARRVAAGEFGPVGENAGPKSPSSSEATAPRPRDSVEPGSQEPGPRTPAGLDPDDAAESASEDTTPDPKN